jgi:hypothetical protein
MVMKKKLLLFVCAIGLVVEYHGVLNPGTAAAPSEEPLLSAADLQYLGAFRVPAGNIGASSFDYGGTGLTYNPANNSLFIVGHPYQQDVAEISIPTPVNNSNLDSLPTANVLQSFADVTDGKMGQIGSGNQMIGGLLPYAGKLYASAYLYYDGAGTQSVSHYVSSPTLGAGGDAQGPYRVGTLGAGFVDGYFAQVPAEWQSILGGPVLTGQCCVSVISRSSFGPAVFTIDPTQLGSVNPLPANPLVYYPQSNPLADYTATSPYFNGATRMGGVAMPAGSRSVLFIGRHGPGAFCYGEGTDNQSLVGQPTGDGAAWCYDPADSAKGTHAYPYSAYVWAYDANDLAAVRNGSKSPWNVVPYGVWPLDLPAGHSSSKMLGGVGYDSARQLLYVSEINGDWDGVCARPLVHVFKLSLGGAPSPSAPAPSPGMSSPRISIDLPAPGTAARQPFVVAGWAIDAGSASGTGIDAVHIYAYPNPGSGAAPVFLGAASMGGIREDVGGIFGSKCAPSGYGLVVNNLPPGGYQIVVYARSTVTGVFSAAARDITVAGGGSGPDMNLETPTGGAAMAGSFLVAGWAIDAGAANGTGVDAVHVWALPADGGAAIFLGVADSGGVRPDVGAVFGSQFTRSGFGLIVPSLAPGSYQVFAFPHSSVTGTFNQSRSAYVNVQ